jgi:hypothetical protein
MLQVLQAICLAAAMQVVVLASYNRCSAAPETAQLNNTACHFVQSSGRFCPNQNPRSATIARAPHPSRLTRRSRFLRGFGRKKIEVGQG